MLLKKKTERKMHKINEKNILQKYWLVSPTRFDMDYLRYEITKFLVGSGFCHFQRGNNEFKIAIWTNTEYICIDI